MSDANEHSTALPDGRAFIRLMRRYVVDYTNRHAQDETAFIMEPDYVLHMGPHALRGRDTSYRVATRRQFDQFPGLGLTVHEMHTCGERLVMRFSEHGASVRHDGALCAWGGIGLYDWNGRRLVRNYVEQDYLSRKRQLARRTTHSVEPPAVAPWDTQPKPRDPQAESVVRLWLESGRLADTPGVLCDDQWTGVRIERAIEQSKVVVNDLFSCGAAVAFHVCIHGRLAADLASKKEDEGRDVVMYAAGLIHVGAQGGLQGRVIRNRLQLQRLLDPGFG